LLRLTLNDGIELQLQPVRKKRVLAALTLLSRQGDNLRWMVYPNDLFAL